MTDELIFEDPPALAYVRKSGTSPLGQWLKELRSHPGQWAKFPHPHVSQGCSGKATQISKGRRFGIAAGEYEACSRRGEDGRYYLYIKFVGGES